MKNLFRSLIHFSSRPASRYVLEFQARAAEAHRRADIEDLNALTEFLSRKV